VSEGTIGIDGIEDGAPRGSVRAGPLGGDGGHEFRDDVEECLEYGADLGPFRLQQGGSGETRCANEQLQSIDASDAKPTGDGLGGRRRHVAPEHRPGRDKVSGMNGKRPEDRGNER